MFEFLAVWFCLLLGLLHVLLGWSIWNAFQRAIERGKREDALRFEINKNNWNRFLFEHCSNEERKEIIKLTREMND